MKTINYRGGIVSFKIPGHWKEEYDTEGGGTFYEDRLDSGTLRVNVLSFQIPSDRSLKDSLNEMRTALHELLKCGFYMERSVGKEEENGELLHLYGWKVYVPVPPIDVRVCCFNYTILAGQEGVPEINEELDLIDNAVCNAKFSTVLGLAGEYHH